MKLSFPLGIALAIAVHSSAFADDRAQIALDRNEVAAELQDMLHQLDAIEQAVSSSHDKHKIKHRGRHYRPNYRLKEVQRRIDRLQHQVYNLKYKVQRAPIVLAEPVVAPMSPRQFSRLLGALRGESFDQSRLRIVRWTASSQWLTAHQVNRVLRTFDFSHYKMQALEALAPRLYDRHNHRVIYAALSFPSERRRARLILRQAPPPQPRRARVAYHVAR